MALTFPVPSFKIDWNGDGDWSDTGEDVSARVLESPGFACERGRDQVRELAPPKAGSASYALDNRSRDYSLANAGSPLAGDLLPGRRTRATATHLGTAYDLWGGVLDDLPQLPAERAVAVPQLGTLSRLAGQRLSTPLYRDIRTDQALGYLLDAAGWPAGERSLDTGQTVLRFWWLDETDAFEALRALVNTEGPGAAVYEDATGTIVFESRHYRLLTSRCTTSQATFRDSGTPPNHYPPFAFDGHLKDVANQAVIPVNIRSAASLGVIWSAQADFSLGASQAIALRATANDPFSDAVAPVLGTDYTVLSGSVASATLDRTSGASATITFTAGAGGATIRNPQLRAVAYPAQAARIANTVDASASIARYGLRPYSLALWPEIDPNVAQDFANVIVAGYQSPRPTASITVAGADDDHLAQCLGREVSDRIHVIEYQSGLDADMFIERVAHHIDFAGRQYLTTFGCEQVNDALYPPDVFILDSATHGVLGTNTLGF